jgi:exonuclease III
MNEKGKLENIKQETKTLKINVLGLSDVRWKGVGDFVSDDFRVIYSGSKGGQRGVAVLCNKEVGNRVTKIVPHSDRLLLVRIKADPVDIVLLQVYMPTTEAEDEEIELMYEQIEDLTKKEKATDQVWEIIMGDWNAVVGEGREEKEVGEFGLGKRNERGQALVDFCKRSKMMVTNTWFEHE